MKSRRKVAMLGSAWLAASMVGVASAQPGEVYDVFARPLTSWQLTMVDWEGQIANPVAQVGVQAPASAVFPVTTTVSINGGLFYFNDPSTVSPSGPSKTFTQLDGFSQDPVYISVYPDRNTTNDNHTLTVTFTDAASTVSTLTVPIIVIDQDIVRPNDFDILVDLSQDATSLFSNPAAAVTFNTAASDWAYFLADMNFDTVPVGAQDSFIWDVSGFITGGFVSNTVAYDGFLMYGHGVTQAVPPYRSGGQPSLHAFHTIGGSPTPLRRSGVVSMETQGNFNQLGWIFDAGDPAWLATQNFGTEQNDFYSIALHEMGHALFFNSGYTLFDDAKTDGLLNDPEVQGQCSCLAFIDAVDHFPFTVDRESYIGVFGSEYERESEISMPVRRWMITKFNLLAAEAIGYELRPTSAFRELEIVTTSLPAGTLGAPYATSLAAVGGVPHYFWGEWGLTVDFLPDGLLLDSRTGAITGTPTESGTFLVTIAVTENSLSGKQALREFSLVIEPTATAKDRLVVY